MLKKNERAAAIQKARRLLKIQSSATLQQIKEAYRERARDLHPDLHPIEERDQWEEQMRETNAAYELIMEYCGQYAFSFAEEVVEQQCRKQDPIEYWKDQFYG